MKILERNGIVVEHIPGGVKITAKGVQLKFPTAELVAIARRIHQLEEKRVGRPSVLGEKWRGPCNVR